MFKTGIVLHYVREYSDEETAKIESVIKTPIEEDTLNPKISLNGDILRNIVNQLPIGTIICKNLTDLKNETVICFPLLSSHISLPVKKGEEVWYFTDSETDFDEKYNRGTPLLSIKNYWISRKIGTKISEDVNYTNIQRNSLISDVDANEDLGYEEIRLPTNRITETYSDRYDEILPDIPLLYDNAKKEERFFPCPVPRWNSKPYELTLQGSNNSLINLTKNINSSNQIEFEGKGAIDLVAGRHTLQEYNSYVGKEENLFFFNESDIKNYNSYDSLNDAKIKPIYLLDSFLKISNVYGDYESLKDPEYYLNYDLPFGTKFEGENNLSEDASRVYISEFDNVDNFKFYDLNFINDQNIGQIDNQSEFNTINNIKKYTNSSSTKEYKAGNENKDLNKINMFNVNIENFGKSNLSITEDKILPTIFLKTNNIRLVARKETTSNFETGILDEGSIRLIKESNNFDSYSHLLLENDGNVLLDGKSIYLGNFKKELLRNNIFQTKQDILNRKDLDNTQKQNKIAEFENQIEALKGKGSSVFIGYDPEYSEPLVLGNTLLAIITEMITLNMSLADEVESLAIALENHVHTGIPNVGLSKEPLDKKPYSDYHSKAHKKLISKHAEVIANLKDMLSKFAKTS